MGLGYESYESLNIWMSMNYKMFRNHGVLQPQESEAASKQSDIGQFFFPEEGKRQAMEVSKDTCIQLLPPGHLVQMDYRK
jgi:hypothetical protein